ncbi:mechanosensitive ion channel family protein [Pelagovum pacificum]|uniref:Small-conductance mechanosensitive channel n=1 Tax=Pelagovum pacificum TaxID=2588711 RepID=A0A5C5G9M5_9RHOB|nr:mechanosensitive ion channel family protein [Pelagovum pacificum]QQA42361.1 mechanosensitive ion channel [Pelagovum pacificum]TNY31445.1 mechanosensitive ion channel [Pelagovum pacificum]
MTFFRILFLALALCLPFSAAAQDDGPNGTITAQNDAQTDAAMATRIREILEELGGYEDVTVTVSEGIVTLRGTTTSITEVTELSQLVNRVEGIVAVKNEVVETSDIVRRLNPAVERFRNRVEQLIVVLPLLLIAGAVFAVIVSIGFIIARWQNPWDRMAPNAFIANLYRAIVRLVFIVVGIVIALDIMNATALLSTILGAAGIIGLAVGFAVRDTVENFIASVMLSIRQPFGPNDVVEINGDQGKVIRLTSRATIILSFDGNHIRIPNATVFKSRIVNYSINPEMRFMFKLAVDFMADLGEAKRIATEAITELPFTLATPAPAVWLGEVTDSGIELVVTGWIDQTSTSLLLARGEALRRVKSGLLAAGIDIPNTTYTIHMAGSGEQTSHTDEEMKRPPPTVEVSDLAEVKETTAVELEAMVNAERNQDQTEDLLRENAQKE